VYLVADDQRSRAKIVRTLVDAGIQVEVSVDADELFQVLRTDSPGCVVIEFAAGAAAAAKLRDRLRAANFAQPVVILGESDQSLRVDPPHAERLVKKPIDRHQLVQAVKESLDVDSRNRAIQLERTELKALLADLNDRERATLKHMLAGDQIKQTAAVMKISTRTVEWHRTRLRKKLGFSSVAHLVQKLAPDLLDF
jgi:FixJ family two-component response regulator